MENQIKLNVNGVIETINLEDITVGQIVQIESNKSMFSNGQYSNLAMSGLITQNMALDILDIYSCYSVLIPDFNKKIVGVESFLSLKPADIKSMIKEFKKEFLPKYLKFLKLLQSDDE